jgi:RNA polymerase sigma-70 factor (ECF subfamily)
MQIRPVEGLDVEDRGPHVANVESSIQRRDAALADALVRGRPRWLGLARTLGERGADGEDAVQRAAERAWSSRDQLRDPTRASAWVARIVRNVVLDAKRRAPKTTAFSEEQIEAPLAEPVLTCECSGVLLGTLSGDQADILTRVVVGDQRVSSYASDRGITPNAAMVRLHRARKALRHRLKDHCGVADAAGMDDCACADLGAGCSSGPQLNPDPE